MARSVIARWIRVSAGALAAVAAMQADAGLREGLDALAKRDYDEARKQFEAAPNDGEALYQRGLMALRGLGQEPDPVNAATWFERAMNLGNKDAGNSFAYALLYGRGAPKDEKRGAAIMEKLAGEGHVQSRRMYAFMLRTGAFGVALDHPKATEMYRRLMEDGDAFGRVQYANALMSGLGVPKDPAKGAALLKEGALAGDEDAMIAYGYALRAGEGVEKDEAEALRQFRAAADKGSAAGQTQVGFAYLFGRGTARDPQEGARWIDAAARQGNVQAQRAYADMFRLGNGVPQNRVDAYKWLTIALGRSNSEQISLQISQERATLAASMSQSDISEATQRADNYRVQSGFKTSTAARVALSREERIQIGEAVIKTPYPPEHVNVWQLFEKMQASSPNDQSSQPTLLVVMSKEDLSRIRLGLRDATYSVLEITRYIEDTSLAVTPKVFVDMSREFRESIIAVGKRRPPTLKGIETVLRDDDRAMAIMVEVRNADDTPRSLTTVGVMLLHEKVIGLRVGTFHPKSDSAAVQAQLVKDWMAELISANKGFFER